MMSFLKSENVRIIYFFASS